MYPTSSKNPFPHLGKLGEKLTVYHTKTKPARTITSFMKTKWSPIVQFIVGLCQMGQSKNFYINMEVKSATKNYVLIINHSVKFKSSIKLTVLPNRTQSPTQQNEPIEKKVSFDKDEKHDFYATIFFLFLHLPKRNRLVGSFRIGRQIVLEGHHLTSFQTLLALIRNEIQSTESGEKCRQFLRHGVRDNQVTQYFAPPKQR